MKRTQKQKVKDGLIHAVSIKLMDKMDKDRANSEAYFRVTGPKPRLWLRK